MKDRGSIAEIACGRAELYNLLVGVFGNLPDKTLIANIKGQGLEKLLDCFHGLENSRFKAGLDHIKSYRSNMALRDDEETLTELSVDRTRILRGTGHTGLRPPYEGFYKNNDSICASALEVRGFYRKAGLLPDETVQESPDYVCIELDFMKNLCLREQDQWASMVDVTETVAAEEEFLREHLGRWIGEFCRQAEKDALTGFYRGFLGILDAVVTIDMQYLHDLAGALK